MLVISGNRSRQRCDGMSRRSFVRIGSMLGATGFGLPDLLRAESASSRGSSQKAIINIHLDGGPSQMDLIDPKPNAPAEQRSPFAPINTNLPGLQLTELMPRVATIANELIFLRSLVGSAARHD